MDNNIFNEKSLERMNSPEQLRDFIQVTRPSIWIIVSAIVILLVGVMFWAIYGSVELTNANGEKQDVHMIEFVVAE